MNDGRRVAILLGLALLARLAVLAPGFGVTNDPDNYLPLARSVASGRGLCLEDGRPTAYRPPLYPILLAPIVSACGVRAPQGIAVVHIVLGLATVALTFATARRWGLSPTRATLAGLVVALDPVLLLQARSVMTETLAAGLVACCLAAATLPSNRGVLLSGLTSGLAGLCRPSLLPGAGLCGLGLALIRPGTVGARAGRLALFVLGMVLTMLPWATRNVRHFGEPVWTTTHGGYTLFLANNPAYYADVLDGRMEVWSGPNQAAWFARVGPETEGMTQVEADRHLRDEGLRMLRERPRDFLRASVARLGRFWGVAPSGAVYPPMLRLASALWTIPIWLALASGLLRRENWRWPRVSAPLAIVGLSAVHAVYWTDVRMRVPILPAVALVASPSLMWSGGKMTRAGRNPAVQNDGNR